MRITILTYGSRGDVQPYVALGKRLQQAGHQVRLAAPERFEDFVTEHGLSFHPLPGDPSTLAAELVDRAGNNPFAMVRVFMKFALPLATRVFEQVREAAKDAGGVIHAFPMTSSGEMVASALGVRHLGALVIPIFTPTQEIAVPALPLIPRFLNRLAHRFFIQMFWQNSRFSYNFFIRPRAPHLPPLGRWPFAPGKPHDTPLLYGFSPSVLSRPADWPSERYVTGYWHLPAAETFQPSKALAHFLASGPAPVYIGFGSMITADREHVREVVLAALALTGQRGILLGGWGGFSAGALPDTVFPLASAPHDWLFPKMAAIVHHGGAGTTGASLRAGVPTIIIPFAADQPFWGQRVFQLGVGPRPISKKRLTVEKLAAAIEQSINDTDMRQRAAALGERIRREDGTGEAVRLIEEYFSES